MATFNGVVQQRDYETRSLLHMITEIRAIPEISAFFALRSLLERIAPKGDGHPVLVLPGFLASDTHTRSLREFLARLGYDVHAWEHGRNPGLSPDIQRKLSRRISRIRSGSSRRVSLVGWSLGGVYARLLAHGQEDDVRQVITLGSPFNLDAMRSVGGVISRIYHTLNAERLDFAQKCADIARQPPPVPSTSIFSRHDGIAPWQCCVDPCGYRTENIRVPGSHCGMSHNPVILYAIAERLSQREYGWRNFDPKPIEKLLFRPFCEMRDGGT